MSTPERYDNLGPGDKVTIEYEVKDVRPDYVIFKAGNRKDIPLLFDTLKALNAVVTRAPREAKPGDTFVWDKYPFPFNAQIKKTLVWMDDRTTVYESPNGRDGTDRFTCKTGVNGKLVYHDFDAVKVVYPDA